MDKIFEFKGQLMKFYARYSRYVDMGLRFILALLTFTFINNHVGFLASISNLAVTLGLAVVCTFLPLTMTVVLAAILVLLQFFTLAPGVAVVSAMLMIIMFTLYFRFTPGKAVVLLLTPVAFTVGVPVLVPVVFGLISGPISAVSIAFGVIIYYMLTYVKAYATVIGTVAEAGFMEQVSSFAQQLFANKEMWLTIISFTICILLVYNIRRLAIDYAWEIAVGAGTLANIIMMTFGHVMMDINISYITLVIGSVVSALIAIIVKTLVFSVDYSRTEHLQFEDDEYYYYVTAVPKVSVAAAEKTVKKINVRQETAMMNAEEVKAKLQETRQNVEIDIEEKRFREELEETEIQKIIEDELKN